MKSYKNKSNGDIKEKLYLSKKLLADVYKFEVNKRFIRKDSVFMQLWFLIFHPTL